MNILSARFDLERMQLRFSGVGILLIVFGSSIALAGLLSIFALVTVFIVSGKIHGSMGMLFFTVLFFPIGIFLVVLGVRIRRRNKQFDILHGTIHSYRRIPLSDLSEKLNLPTKEVESLIALSMASKDIEGFIDRETGEFVTGPIDDRSKTFTHCNSCGASFGKIYLKGETVKCKTCGSLHNL
ncbi:PCI domain-containing protein [Spirochaetota bacterium]